MEINNGEMKKKYALVTGASGGIGKELAIQFAKNGYDLVLISRRKKVLQNLADELYKLFGTESEIIEKDLEETNSAKEVVQLLSRKKISIKVLVNNAGFGTFGEFTESDFETNSKMVQLNITTLINLTHLILPSMLEKKEGKILNVASMAAFQPGPFMAIYYATKSFVLSFSESLSSELKGRGITVTALCPGPVPTGFQERAGANKAMMMNSVLTKSAEFVAKCGYFGLIKGRRVVIPGMINKLLIGLENIIPNSILINIVKNLMHKRKN
ncbi:MAG: SDR family oxidoreductase [Bacteroidetes bacterium]|nr:SDR family oxidoreductase [Bacteroidota bacterium]